MISYEVNCNTLALIPVSDLETKVIENDNIFIVKKNATDIIEDSCEYFGSSYLGRHEGTKKLIGVSYKAPIIIEDTNNMIYFPTTSPRLSDCIWIALNNIQFYEEKNGKTEIIFQNNKRIMLNISYGSFDNQVLRATKLDSILRKRLNAAE